MTRYALNNLGPVPREILDEERRQHLSYASYLQADSSYWFTQALNRGTKMVNLKGIAILSVSLNILLLVALFWACT